MTIMTGGRGGGRIEKGGEGEIASVGAGEMLGRGFTREQSAFNSFHSIWSSKHHQV